MEKSKTEASAAAAAADDLDPHHDTANEPITVQSIYRTLSDLMPGLLLCATIAMAATFLSQQYSAPVMLFALLIGMALHPLLEKSTLVPGVQLASRTILKVGVALLGVRITTGEVYALGPIPVGLAVFGVSLSILAGCLMAQLSGRTRSFGILTGGAVGICGASAALALSSVLPKGKHGVRESDVIFTVLAVTTLSTVAMVLYPIVSHALGLSNREAGIFIGATVHDVAQVVGAGYSVSAETGDVATVTKLFRVALLVPVIGAIAYFMVDGAKTKSVRQPRDLLACVPPFLIAFVALVLLNSLGAIPTFASNTLSDVSKWCLVIAISGLGLKTSVREIGDLGPGALAMVVSQTVLLMSFAICVILWFG
ncbi:MAG: putative sulfate exporter family transporter [Pseudomonadota bacterium]